jgi:predicted ATP-grasp superfamily ATP-dependent carboligase
VLAVARSLGRRGLEVHLGWCPAESPAHRSRYVAASHRLSPYRHDRADWKQDLGDLLQRESYDLVVPCNDSTVVPLQVHCAEFAAYGELYLIPQRAFEVAFDKFHTYELARSLGIAVPAGGVFAEADEALRGSEGLGYPLILKPRSTFPLQSQGGSRVVERATDRADLRDRLKQPKWRDGVLVQERFAGTGLGVELLACKGCVLTAFQHVRIHETMEYGSSYRRSAPLTPALLDAAARLMKALDYTGVAMVEFIVDLATGGWALLEINGRFWGSLPLAVAAGADFPYYLYQMLVEGRREFPTAYRSGVRCRNLVLDWQAQMRTCRAAGLSWPRRLARIARHSSNLLLLRDHFDNLTWDDPWPGLVELAGLGHARAISAVASAAALCKRAVRSSSG